MEREKKNAALVSCAWSVVSGHWQTGLVYSEFLQLAHRRLTNDQLNSFVLDANGHSVALFSP